MVNMKLTESDMFTNKMDTNLDVFCPPMVQWVWRHVHGGDIVVEGHRHAVDGAVQFVEELPEPNAFDHNISHHTIFNLHARARHHRLSLARPRHQGLAEEDAVTRRGSLSVWAPNPVRIGVHRKRSR